MKKIPWDVEEMVAIVDIYYKSENESSIVLSQQLKQLSAVLIHRADILKIEHDEKYRNYNGMKMIFENVRYVATNGEKGFSGAGQLIYDVINLYNNNLSVFYRILKEFNEKYQLDKDEKI